MKKDFFYHYGTTLQEQARELRANLTEPERKLWFCFLKDQTPKFSCQKVIGPYIVDFYCPALSLAIELDGESHTETVKHDRIRTEYLKNRNIQILRFTNQEVMKQFRPVCEAIEQKMRTLVPPAQGAGTAQAVTGGLTGKQFFRSTVQQQDGHNPPPASQAPPCRGGTRGLVPPAQGAGTAQAVTGGLTGKQFFRSTVQQQDGHNPPPASQAPPCRGGTRGLVPPAQGAGTAQAVTGGLTDKQFFRSTVQQQDGHNPPAASQPPPCRGGTRPLVGKREHYIFKERNPMKTVTIYTDGACSGNPGPGGWGAILSYQGVEKELSSGEANTTNNRMELTAVITALEALREPCVVELYSDSKYVIDALEKRWVWGWKRRGWIKSDKKPALNVDLWERLLPLVERHELHYHWVKGHAENEKNNRCDQMAVAESKKFR